MKKDYFLYILALLIFGSNGVVAHYIPLSSGETVYLRAAIGSVLLVLLFFLFGNRPTAQRHKKDSIFIILSGAAMAADWLLLFEAYDQIGVSLSLLINYCGPVLVLVLSAFVLKEKLTARKIAAALAAFFGVVLIGGKAAVSGVNAKGLFCAVLSAFAYCAMVLLNKLSKNVKGIENAALQLLSAAAVITVYTAFRGGLLVSIPKESIFFVLLLGVVNTGIGCFLYFSAASRLPAQSVAVCGYLEPLSAVVFSALILKETLFPLQILGAAFIIGGALFGEINKKST